MDLVLHSATKFLGGHPDAAAGTAPGQVRISVGVEDPDTLLADLRRALDSV